ncbi:hypothetical protein LTR09_004732 [Extremus antarcticus]|uniref:DUF726-domain-containing protein n=1 Tax=Extremus antarcticus TaxID=702011 RepID=A0AAJ0GCW2_9PEZI|nr:hypothetical protein LTR09_004732 [Extremus antarcticus]
MPAEDGGDNALHVSKKDAVVNGVVEQPVESRQEKQDAPKGETEADEFGLPVRPARRRRWSEEGTEKANGTGGDEHMAESEVFEDAQESPVVVVKKNVEVESPVDTTINGTDAAETQDTAVTTEPPPPPVPEKDTALQDVTATSESPPPPVPDKIDTGLQDTSDNVDAGIQDAPEKIDTGLQDLPDKIDTGLQDAADRPPLYQPSASSSNTGRERRGTSSSQSPTAVRQHASSVSEWSHQQAIAPKIVQEDYREEEQWQEMPAFATHRIYDDWGKVLAKEYDDEEGEHLTYSTLGGAGKGYTRVQIDDDAESATSMDDNTAYLFKDLNINHTVYDEDEEGKDVMSQMKATKELLTEGQRIAYVGVVRLSIGKMLDALNQLERTKGAKKQIEFATEAMKMWGQKMMVRLYSHMEIDSAEQVMVEQLAEHGVLPSDLTPALMQNARVKNPTNVESETSSVKSGGSAGPSIGSPRPSSTFEKSAQSLSVPGTPSLPEPPPAYQEHTADELTIQDRSEIEGSKNLDIDIRWTVLCDLFLLLVADSTYDARSRTLLEHVGEALSVDWQEVCRFEKRIADALEMQEQADKENWNEEEHLESRKKQARNKRLMVMGLCTVGGGLVIGLSAGALAPLIGAGLAAGFTGIGVLGTGSFLGGAGAAALIGTAGTVTGSVVGSRASSRRTGSVKTFEYRPLFNNKRTNLIVTVSGWMTGGVDDVRLPFSTVDPIMGDIYSVNWEPDMLRSTGQTIQILATEALTQTIQQILGATVLTALMAGLTLPLILTKLSYLIDNPWTVSLARADATGLILADSIIDRNLGVRPITLVGFSLGSRVIFSCLKELAKRGAIGLVQNVYLFGSPIVAKKEEYLRARTVVSGRFLNGYASNDWILGYLFRATSGGIMRVSGLSSIDVPGIENKDVTELVPGHMAYRGMMPTLLSEVGWAVDGLEFNEIEDPDPENHEKRQRELLNEIETARRELEDKNGGKKAGGFKSFFRRKKAAKQTWETYDERSQKVLEGDDAEAERMAQENVNVMFDVDAIRAEALKLALEGGDIEDIKRDLSVREIESTMPTLKIESSAARPDTSPAVVNGTVTPKDGLRQTKSYDETTTPSSSSRPQPQAVDGYSNGHVTEEEVRMSFDTSNEPRASTPKNPSQLSLAPDTIPRHLTPDRPPLKSASTSPALPSSSFSPAPPAQPLKNPSHNPWADDEEEFGQEKDVQMSFE